MHERSLATALVNQVVEHARARRATRVTEVQIQLGPLSGVEPLLLASAFQELALMDLLAGAVLRIAEVPLVARCDDCNREFEVQRFRFRCPGCSSGHTRVLQGDGVVLENIVIVDESFTAESTAQV